MGAKNIAILYQDDSFGRAGLSGVKAALDKRGMALAAEGTYTRNTTAVKGALVNIRKANPDAIVTVGAYKPIAEFIKTARQLQMDVPILNISFTGAKALVSELEGQTDNVIMTQVVPFPFDTSIPLVAEYQAALKAADPAAEPGFVSLEGYMVGKLTVEALKKTGADVTRQGFIDAVKNTGTFDLGGVSLVYGEGDNQGMDDVFLTTMNPDGSFNSVSSLK